MKPVRTSLLRRWGAPGAALSAALCAAGASPGAIAQTATDLQHCRALTDDRVRLACYDALAAGAAPATPAPVVRGPAEALRPPHETLPTAPAAAPAAAGAAEADFGRSAAGLRQIDSRIDGPFEGWDRRTRFRLANGQVWEVSDSSSASLALRDPVVRIRRAALGSFLMEIEGTNRTVRVRRVQ